MSNYEFKNKNNNKKVEHKEEDKDNIETKKSKCPPEYIPYKKDRYNRKKDFNELLEDFLKESKDKQKHVKTEFVKERKNKVNKNKDKDNREE